MCGLTSLTSAVSDWPLMQTVDMWSKALQSHVLNEDFMNEWMIQWTDTMKNKSSVKY